MRTFNRFKIKKVKVKVLRIENSKIFISEPKEIDIRESELMHPDLNGNFYFDCEKYSDDYASVFCTSSLIVWRTGQINKLKDIVTNLKDLNKEALERYKVYCSSIGKKCEFDY